MPGVAGNSGFLCSHMADCNADDVPPPQRATAEGSAVPPLNTATLKLERSGTPQVLTPRTLTRTLDFEPDTNDDPGDAAKAKARDATADATAGDITATATASASGPASAPRNGHRVEGAPAGVLDPATSRQQIRAMHRRMASLDALVDTWVRKAPLTIGGFFASPVTRLTWGLSVDRRVDRRGVLLAGLSRLLLPARLPASCLSAFCLLRRGTASARHC